MQYEARQVGENKEGAAGYKSKATPFYVTLSV